VTIYGAIAAMNPAHMLYESIIARVEDGGQGEPVGLINDASFTAAADTLFAEGFGLCTTWDGDESAEEFQARICNVIGAALSQSRVDGQYYLDLIRDDYVLAALPIISEDDVIDVTVEPTNLSEAINQVQVGWFDQVAKENRLTPPLSSLGGIQAAGGVIAKSFIHREIPSEAIAMRVAARYLAIRSLPLSRYTLSTNRRPYALRPGKLFRLQLPSEGIGDVVCLAGEIDYGELANGRMKIVALQDVFGLPSAVFVDPTRSVDDPVISTPFASANRRVFEAPYVELAASLAPVNLAALPADAGYLSTVATRPPGMGLGYAIFTAAGAEAYVERGEAEWCPSALVVGAATRLATAFTIDGGSGLAQVAVGSWALWDDEIVRVDAINAALGTLTLGRGCADTVPATHAAGTGIYFAGDWVGADTRDYAAGEVVNAKLLTRTASAREDLATATARSVTMAGRAARPYPPGRMRVDGVDYPAANAAAANMAVTWAHRDRLLQADTLLDTSVTSVGPEPTTRYALRCLNAATGALIIERTDLAGTSAQVILNFTGAVRLHLYSISDAGQSLQRHVHTLDYTPPAGTVASSIAGAAYIDARASVAIPIIDGVATLDWSTGEFFTLALTANAALVMLNPPPVGSAILNVVQSGGFALTLPGSVVPITGVPYATTPTAGAVDVLGFMTTDGGLTYFLVAQKPVQPDAGGGGGGGAPSVTLAPSPASATTATDGITATAPSVQVTASVAGGTAPITHAWTRADSTGGSDFAIDNAAIAAPTFSIPSGITAFNAMQTWRDRVTDTAALTAQATVGITLTRTAPAPPASVTLSPNPAAGFAFTPFGTAATASVVVTATRTGMVGPLTQTWERISGEVDITASFISGGNSCQFQFTASQNSILEAVYRHTTTDTGDGGATYSSDVTVTLEVLDDR